MNKLFPNTLIRTILLLALLTITGCSTIDSYRLPSQSTVRSLPQIPEIKRQQTIKPRYTAPQKAVARAPRVLVKPDPQQTAQTERAAQLAQQQKFEEQQRLQQLAQKKATVDIDPYASIPENSSNSKPLPGSTISNGSVSTSSSASSAVKSLMASARADIAIGRSRSAISKIERGLRIEPGNAQAWHMLAKAHYSNSAFLHSISIAKKSNALTSNEDLIAENWKLIKLAGERSGNASAIKEALDYMKVNP
ncbi:MAG: hypothetical protein V7749_06060 [Cocleimonas sp.]